MVIVHFNKTTTDYQVLKTQLSMPLDDGILVAPKP
jgi:hypothetical protein